MELLNKISEHMFLPKEKCLSFLISVPNRYKRYNIPKRNGNGTRLIAHPAKSVKPLQRTCVAILREYLPVHSSATAYESGTGIKLNADKHRHNRFLLKMDFVDFFPSITPEVLQKLLLRHEVTLSNEDQLILTVLLFWRKSRKGGLELSIGAPSSPFISNAVMYFFDVAISEYCNEKQITYTRYADDLTFSTNVEGVLFDVPAFIANLLNNDDFSFLRINSAKTIFASKRTNRHITGVTITNEGTLSLGRNRKREISAAIHHFTTGKLSSEEVHHLKGMLGFAKHIEPNFIVRMARKYSDEIIDRIQKYQ